MKMRPTLMLVVLCGTALNCGLPMARAAHDPDRPRPGADGGYYSGNNGTRDRATMMMERLAVELALSDAQRAKIQPILIMGMEQRSRIRQDAGLSVEERYNRMKQNRATGAAKIRTILTPAQKKKFEAFEKEWAERMRSWMLGQGFGPGRPPMRRDQIPGRGVARPQGASQTAPQAAPQSHAAAQAQGDQHSAIMPNHNGR